MWIIGAELMMAVSLAGMLSVGDLTADLALLGWFFFVHNCFASLQEVATDALAVDVLPPDEQGRTNGLMWGTKLIGKAVGAAGMAHVMARWGLSAAVLTQFILLLVIMLFPLLIVERPGEKLLPWSKGRATTTGSASSLRSPAAVLRDVRRAFALVTTSVFFVFGILATTAFGVVDIITKALYTQQLEWTFVELSDVSAFAVAPEMIGAVAGGYLADRFGRRRIIATGFASYGLLAVVFGSCPALWKHDGFTAAYLVLYPGAMALGTVGILSMAMRISWTKAAATVFTIFLTVGNLGQVVGDRLAGSLRDEYQWSYPEMFLLAGAVSALPVLLLPLVRTKQVDELKRAD